MRSAPKIRRVQLKINHSDESVILGIASAEPDYKLSLTLNKILGISLRNSTPVDTGSETSFSRFTDQSASDNPGFDLISNRAGKSCLIAKLKNIDYFLKIHDPDNEEYIEKIISKLREADCITAVFNIDTGSIRDKNLCHLIH